MSSYDLGLGNIGEGWYAKTTNPNYAPDRDRIDAIWSPKCVDILESFLSKYGMFFTVFTQQILIEIDAYCKANLAETVRYHDYYFANKVLEIPKLKVLWLDSIERNKDKTFTCQICRFSQSVFECHRELIQKYGIEPPYCKKCDYLTSRYSSFGQDILEHLKKAIPNMGAARQCEICSNSYTIENTIYAYGSFGISFVDCLYPNFFVSICPKCFKNTFSDYKSGSQKTRLSHLYDLFLFLDKIPTQDFERLFYLFNDRDSILKLFNIMSKCRTPNGYKEEFGSFFGALVKSGILPEGTRRLEIGTMVLAKDGHLCLSLAEKEIDDFLSESGISHKKEVYYPDSNFRTDWELFGFSTRIFVEYFGLMNNKDYAVKSRTKVSMAKQNGILLLELYPELNWKQLLIMHLHIPDKQNA